MRCVSEGTIGNQFAGFTLLREFPDAYVLCELNFRNGGLSPIIRDYSAAEYDVQGCTSAVQPLDNFWRERKQDVESGRFAIPPYGYYHFR